MSGHFSALLQAQAQSLGPRVPVSVLTGFLGSGKTTLLNRLLSSADLAGTAVIVNEFGETGLDHELLTSASADDVVLLPHIASSTRETRGEMGRLVIKNLEAWFSGKPLVTPTPETLAMLANR
jgi:phosphoglycerate dehydrogenase-like enzyme